MKNIFRSLSFLAIFALLFSACDKVDDLPVYADGTTPVLTSSKATVAPTATDSLSTVVEFSWSSPEFATDTATYKYVLQIDTAANGSFSKAISKTVIGSLSTGFIGKELNTILVNYGFAFNVPHDIYVRLVASYGNNNQPLYSNTVKVNASAYKIPPLIPVPAALYIVGDLNGYNNSAGLDMQYKFSLVDETTYGAVINFPGGGAYKLIQILGDWSTQFHMVAGGTSASGQFVQADADPGFTAPATAGWYKVLVDFQHGTYTVAPITTPFTGTAPTDLFLVGDASPGGWDNPVPAAQKFTKVSTTLFELTVTLNAGKQYLFLPVNGSWDHKFGGTDKAFSSILADNDVPGTNTPAPDVTASYKIVVNFANHSYAVTKQ